MSRLTLSLLKTFSVSIYPNGVNPQQTLDLGHQPLSGSIGLAAPPGTWQATLRATNSAGLTATLPLGTLTQPG